MDYSYSFQDNIPSSSFNSTCKNVLNWITENREKIDWAKDPNAYEMTNLFLFGAKYASEGRQVDTDTLSQMWDIRSKDFERCNISENHFVYAICKDAFDASISGRALVNDENSHHALRRMAELGLYLKQQQRDNGEIKFNDPQKLLQLLECSSSLKTFHPNLYDRYSFERNINVLCKLQLENDISPEVSQAIEDLRTKLENGIGNAEVR